jgi:hypothetical protein
MKKRRVEMNKWGGRKRNGKRLRDGYIHSHTTSQRETESGLVES